MNKKTMMGLAAVVVLAIAGIIIYLLMSEPDDEIERIRGRAEGQFEDPTQQLEEFAAGGYRITYEQVLSDYESWSKYPPESRPLQPEFLDEIEHHKIVLPFQPMPVVGPDGKLKEGEHRCRLQPLEHTVVEGQSMLIHLVCENVQQNAAVAVKVDEIKLVRYLDTQTWQVPSPEVEPATAANNFITKLTWKPRREDWGNMDLRVKFTIPAEKEAFVHEQKAHFYSSPVTPAVFTGNMSERIVDGSLVVSVELDVKIAGRYEIKANLFTQDEKPVAIAKKELKLNAGRQQADLLFFGKIFHDRKANGPYRIRGLRGFQDNDPLDPELLEGPPQEVEKLLASMKTTEPDKRVIPVWNKDLSTRQYKISDFSDKEYDSEFKQERIKELQQLAQEN